MVHPYPDFVVLTDPDADRARRVDLAHGDADVWNHPYKDVSFAVEYLPEDAAGPAYPDGQPLKYSAKRHVLVRRRHDRGHRPDDAEGRHHGPPSRHPVRQRRARHRRQYYTVGYESSGYQVQAFPLSGNQPQNVYIADSKASLDNLAACGGGVCVQQTVSGEKGVPSWPCPQGRHQSPVDREGAQP